MICKRKIMCVLLMIATNSIKGQEVKNNSDSLSIMQLPDITVVGKNSNSDFQTMPETVGTNIYAGKKNSLIILENIKGNIVNNTMRQVMAKIPGIHIWESDPSGIQIGIAARGLSPNRSWEFNVRQNGHDISADPFGYPEAYYNPQLQAVQRIEVVRGQGSLQYGPQFGGLLNYILRNGSDIKKPFAMEFQQTFGSNGLYNSYTGIGGNKGKLHYYSFFDHRNGNGWRANSHFYTNGGFGTVTYHVNDKMDITTEFMFSHFRSQQPGGLTDPQFMEDPKQSLRKRNWMDIKWLLPAVIFNYKVNHQTTWNTKLFATVGDRNSVGFLQPMTVKDSINQSLMTYNNRVINLDKYRNIGFESRLLTNFQPGKNLHTFSVGLRLYKGNTFRLADGKGTSGETYDLSLIGKFPRDARFQTTNIAAFMENIFRVSEKFKLIPGARFEWIQGSSAGRFGFDPNGKEIMLQNITRNRSFMLLGIGSEYHFSSTSELYSSFSQAYRPIQFASLQAPPTTDIIDENLKDAKGFNYDLGFRGKVKNFLQYDISGFYLKYDNRVGTITAPGTNFRYVTNVGASASKGIEAFSSIDIIKAFKQNQRVDLQLFFSYSYTDAKYDVHHKDKNIQGKKVENAPAHILRTGITTGYRYFSMTAQVSSVGSAYSDANNTILPTANGNTGIIPSYAVADLTFEINLPSVFKIKAGINNIFDKRYFTRRASGYPGPGIMPADGRTFFLSVEKKF